MIQKILSWLLFHANRQTKDKIFYDIKNKILSRYGVKIGFDVQFIEGKKCWSCGGTGIYDYGFQYSDECWDCYFGWYKRPVWNILDRIKLGNHIFHQPLKRIYNKKDVPECTKIIDGYIVKPNSKHGKTALTILYLIYDFKGFWKRWYNGLGRGYYTYWWRFGNFINNIAHIIRYKSKAIPFDWLMKKRNIKYKVNTYDCSEMDDLPF